MFPPLPLTFEIVTEEDHEAKDVVKKKHHHYRTDKPSPAAELAEKKIDVSKFTTVTQVTIVAEDTTVAKSTTVSIRKSVRVRDIKRSPSARRRSVRITKRRETDKKTQAPSDEAEGSGTTNSRGT